MELQLICEWIFRKRKTTTTNVIIRLPNDLKPLEKGNYVIRIFKLDLEV